MLMAKGFDGAYVHRLMLFVTSGHTAVAVNGVVGPYFTNGNVLWQGDHIAPLLFNFVADVILCILSRAANAGHILPVASQLISSGLSHLQYSDNIIMIVELNDFYIANMKFILLCFEALSGLKTNFNKSEVILTGSSDEEGLRVANTIKKDTFVTF